jgi:biopolymer transport protein ExbD
MIDVVFQLIIFFLVASHLAHQESQVELSLPSASSGEPIQEARTRTLTVNVRSEGTILLTGQPVTPEELGRKLAFEKSNAGEDVEVRIRADRGVPYRAMEPILLACARSGLWKVSIAVVEAENRPPRGGT